MPSTDSKPQQIVAVLSFALEANVFNPVPRGIHDFQHLKEDAYRENERQAGFIPKLKELLPHLFVDINIKFVCLYRGFCGGLIPAVDFDTMKAEAKRGLQALERVDGVFLDLHGAMCVEGAGASGDAEAEIVESVREAVFNRNLIISASFDLHGNFSERLAEALDLVTAYKTMPHIDMEETKTKGLRMLLEVLQKGIPRTELAIQLIKIPAVISGDTVMTTEGHGVGLYQSLKTLEEEKKDCLLDASLFVGHQHANEFRMGAAVVFTILEAASESLAGDAQKIAQQYWDLRKLFDFPSACKLKDWKDCLSDIYNFFDKHKQVLVGDFGDNICAGASGDVPFVLDQLITATSKSRENGQPSVLVLGLVDPVAVGRCVEEGQNAQLPTLEVGNALTGQFNGHNYGNGCGPVVLHNVKVARVLKEGAWVLIEVGSQVVVLLQKKAWAFFGPGDFQALGAEFTPNKFSVTVSKLGMNLMDLLDCRISEPGQQLGFKECILANTPGACHEPLPVRNCLVRVYPFDDHEWEAPLAKCARRPMTAPIAAAQTN